MATTWTRDTPWRQGHVLSAEAVHSLGLVHPETPDSTCVVVISHDCDLANDTLQIEPDVEVIIGRHLQKGDGNYFWAKAPRTLHVDALQNGTAAVVELVATAKRLISKQALAAFSPDAAYSLPGKSLSALRSWLGVRYNRAAFPDPFVDRLSQSKADKRLAKIIEPVGNLLSAVYFDVDGGKEIDHSDGSPYELKIVLAYPPGDDPEQAADDVEKLETAISDLGDGVWRLGDARRSPVLLARDLARVLQEPALLDRVRVAGGDIRVITPRPRTTRGSPFGPGVEWLALEERFTFYGGGIALVGTPAPVAQQAVADPATPVFRERNSYGNDPYPPKG